MNNIKIISLYTIIIAAIATHNCSWTGLTDEFQKVFPGAGVAGVKAADELLANHQDTLEKVTKELGSEAARKLGSEAAEKLAPAFKMLGAGVLCHGIYKLTYAIGDTYRYFNPDEEQKQRLTVARKYNERSESESKLRDCLMKNAWTPRNDEGIPSVCDDFSRQYHMLAGQSALNEMTDNFKDAYKE